jgi:thiol-disulfide isomerase/thioredoxin
VLVIEGKIPLFRGDTMQFVMNIRHMIIATFAFFTILSSIIGAQTSDLITIKLRQKYCTIDDNSWKHNIFFDDVRNEKIKYPSEWKNVQIALLIGNKGYIPVYIIMYSDSEGDKYRIDSNSNLDFSDDKDLYFKTQDALKYSETTINVCDESNKYHFPIHYRISFEGKYSYAMISEYREGEITVKGKIYKLQLKLGRGEIIYDLSGAAYILIDINGDSIIKERSEIKSSGEILLNEEFSLTDPFVIDDQKYEAAEISKDGYNLVLKKSLKNSAPSVGFEMPDIALKDFDGKEHSLIEYRGKMILLQFWSANCPHAESIREDINKIIKQSNNHCVSINIPLEKDTDEIKKYLSNHMSESTFLLADEATKDKFNPQGNTPLFYILDGNGKIIFKELGSNCISVIRALIK